MYLSLAGVSHVSFVSAVERSEKFSLPVAALRDGRCGRRVAGTAQRHHGWTAPQTPPLDRHGPLMPAGGPEDLRRAKSPCRSWHCRLRHSLRTAWCRSIDGRGGWACRAVCISVNRHSLPHASRFVSGLLGPQSTRRVLGEGPDDSTRAMPDPSACRPGVPSASSVSAHRSIRSPGAP